MAREIPTSAERRCSGAVGLALVLGLSAILWVLAIRLAGAVWGAI